MLTDARRYPVAEMKSLTDVRADFDRIARLSAELPDVLGPYEEEILGEIPRDARNALDLGCGLGGVARRIASRGIHATGIDLSPAMIEGARRRSEGIANVEFHVAEAEPWLEANENAYDVITAMAVLHHMPLESLLPRIVRALRPGGAFLVVDLLDRSSLRYAPLNAFALAVGVMRDLMSGTFTMGERRAAWRDHGKDERYLTAREAHEIYARLLPGARVRQHLLWRYSVIWRGGRPRPPDV